MPLVVMGAGSVGTAVVVAERPLWLPLWWVVTGWGVPGSLPKRRSLISASERGEEG